MRRMMVCLPLCFLIIPWVTEESDSGAREDIAAFVDDSAQLPDTQKMEKLAQEDPIIFLENCLRKYTRSVKGYHCTFLKQERLSGKLQPSEVIAATFRQEPYGVFFKWKEGTRLAQSALYLEGENQEKIKGQLKGFMLVHPAGLAGKLAPVVRKDPNGEEAKQQSRYSLTDFGLEKGTLRTWNSWKKAKETGNLHVEYQGIVKLKEANDRPCFKLRRFDYQSPEEDGITELVIYVDTETWLQIGSELKGHEDKWVARYYFKDLQLNPEIPDDVFKSEALLR
jgi:hypothetical protein